MQAALEDRQRQTEPGTSVLKGQTESKHILKSVGPKLVPFFKTVAIYFVIFIPAEQPSLFALILKCLPVLSLIAFVLLHGMSLGEELVMLVFLLPDPQILTFLRQ
ncbi:unnamed protein product, partial [Meganyctiphanes norvegica]